MKRIICLLILVFFLSAGATLADKKFEFNLIFGSYNPSFSSTNNISPPLRITGHGPIRGCSVAYQITPKSKIRLQIDFSEFKAEPRYIPIDMKLQTTAASMLGEFDLFQYGNRRLYGGIGVIDYRIVRSWWHWFGSPITRTYDFGFPWGAIVLFGLATPLNQSCEVKGEIHYVTGTDGELFGIPLDWDGFKFLISLGLKF